MAKGQGAAGSPARVALREMLSWPDADLERVEVLRRELVAAGTPKSLAALKAAEAVRNERHARRSCW